MATEAFSRSWRTCAALIARSSTSKCLGAPTKGARSFAVRIAGPSLDGGSAPALLAIFGEHGDEHDVIDLGIGLIEYLATNYGVDANITDLLDREVVWIVPMMNPPSAP